MWCWGEGGWWQVSTVKFDTFDHIIPEWRDSKWHACYNCSVKLFLSSYLFEIFFSLKFLIQLLFLKAGCLFCLDGSTCNSGTFLFCYDEYPWQLIIRKGNSSADELKRRDQGCREGEKWRANRTSFDHFFLPQSTWGVRHLWGELMDELVVLIGDSRSVVFCFVFF